MERIEADRIKRIEPQAFAIVEPETQVDRLDQIVGEQLGDEALRLGQALVQPAQRGLDAL